MTTNTASAPVEIGRVTLTVRDLAKTADFYQSALGFDHLSGDGTAVVLGAGDHALLELRADPAARQRSAREAGLFHTAFLLPSRPALGGWLLHAANSGVQLQGASDHGVSEAIYLADPEGNGIEVYRDRPRQDWHRKGEIVEMGTEALDLNAVAAAADGPWKGVATGSVVGHVHLQVGSLPEAEAFYAGTLGFTVTNRYTGALFYGSGGYHHHIGTNVWNSRGAGQRTFPSTGLAGVELLADADALAAIAARAGGQSLTDPWGTEVTLIAKGA